MNRIYLSITILCIMSLFACNKDKKDLSLYYNGHLNDTTHIGNLDIKIKKLNVLKTITKFDDWYQKNYKRIYFNKSTNFWNMVGHVNVDNKTRIKVIKDSIVPKINNCPYISDRLKQKAFKNSQKEDPFNLGVILTQNERGKDLWRFTFMNGHYHGFHGRKYLSSPSGEGTDDIPRREITKEEAEFYQASMIKLYNNSHACYRTLIDMTNLEDYRAGYLVLELIKLNDNWLIDDIYYIEEKEIIENPDLAAHKDLPSWLDDWEAYEKGDPSLKH